MPGRDVDNGGASFLRATSAVVIVVAKVTPTTVLVDQVSSERVAVCVRTAELFRRHGA